MQYFERILSRSPLRNWSELTYRNRLRVLVYHEVDDSQQFERQIQWLKSEYQIISLEELELGNIVTSANDRDPLLISFDDARRSVYEAGWPILKKYDVPAVVFVITSLIGTESPFWWDEVKHYLDSDQNARQLLNKLKALPEGQRRERVHSMRMQNEGKEISYPHLSWEELRKMEKEGICVANHTHTHPILDRCKPESIRNEISRSMVSLEKHGLSGSRYLAYPNGNFNDTVINEAKSAGIKLGFRFDHRINKEKIDPFRISRLSVHSDTSIEKLALICSGLHSFLLPMRTFFSGFSLKNWPSDL